MMKFIIGFFSFLLLSSCSINSKVNSLTESEKKFVESIEIEYGPTDEFNILFLKYGYDICFWHAKMPKEPGISLYIASSALLTLCPWRLQGFNIF